MLIEVRNALNGRSIRVNGVVNDSPHTVLPMHVALDLGLLINGNMRVGCCSVVNVGYSYVDLAINNKAVRAKVVVTGGVNSVIIGLNDLRRVLTRG